MNNNTHHHQQLRPPPPTSINTASNANLPSSPKPTATPECGNCGFRNRWILHHVRLRGLNRRLCTSCVLRLHPSSFCPYCFQFYDPSTSPQPRSSNRLICCKCSSIAHSNCNFLTSSFSDTPPLSPSSSSTSYLCPPCAKPNFSFFDLDGKPTSSSDLPDYSKTIDRKAALVLLCAAKIASTSMAKAVIVVRADAERKVREAACARKRAREALEHVALVVAKEKARRKEGLSDISGSVIKEEKKWNLGSNNGSSTANASAMGLLISKSGIGGMQRKDICNGIGGLNSLTKKEVLVALEEGIRPNKTEIDECVKSNGTAAAEKDTSGSFTKEESDNGEANHEQNRHNVRGNPSKK